MHLKSELHLKIQKIVGDLENASNIGLLQSQLKYLRDSHAFISYKLAVYDGIPCTEHYILWLAVVLVIIALLLECVVLPYIIISNYL